MVARVDLAANLQAALLLQARPILHTLGLAQITAKAVLEATGATKTRAYELSRTLQEQLETLIAPVGRPTASADEPTAKQTDMLLGLTRSVLEYLYKHPGAAQRTATKTHYSSGFRDFVVGLCKAHVELDVERLVAALSLPVTTVRDWLRAARAGIDLASDQASDQISELASNQASDQASDQAEDGTSTPAFSLAGGSVSALAVQTVLAQWSHWNGKSFGAFCDHLKLHHGVPFGRTTIASILEHAGERQPSKRKGRSPDEKALRDAFASYFPGAVWVGDGCELAVQYVDQLYRFNLELVVDTHSGAFVGLDVRDHEDADAVIAAFDQGVVTTSTAPLALLLDNKPSNHASAVHDAVEATLLIPATRSRAQNKGHVEGAFGLFSQHAPPLCVEGQTDKERARSLLELCTMIFFGALNMRPRAKRGNRSRIELYREHQATPEQVEQAKAALQARLDKQLAAQQTLRARQDPAKRAYLDSALPRLDLDDPTGHVQAAIARYDLDDIANGVALFSGKQRAGTLPAGVDARYLLGIVRNLAAEREGLAIATALWDERINARDFAFVDLLAQRNAMASADSDAQLIDCVDRALASDRHLEQYFWLDAVANLVLEHPPKQQRAAFDRAARRIHTNYRVPHRLRLHATRVLASKVLPLS